MNQKHAEYDIRALVAVSPKSMRSHKQATLDLVPLSSFCAFIISIEHPMPFSALE